MNLDQALRDAAEPVPARVARPSAQQMLTTIVRSPVPAAGPARSRPVRAASLVAAALVAVVAALVLPRLGGGTAAYASWSPSARPLPAAEQAELAGRCDDEVRPVYETREPGRSILGEQRGEYAAVSLGAGGWSATCFRDRDGTVLNSSFLNEPVSPAELGRTGIELQGWPQVRTSEGYCRLMAGHVGSDVAFVDIVVDGGGDEPRVVRATVGGGYFLAWYPAPADGATVTTLTLGLTSGETVTGISASDLMQGPILD